MKAWTKARVASVVRDRRTDRSWRSWKRLQSTMLSVTVHQQNWWQHFTRSHIYDHKRTADNVQRCLIYYGKNCKLQNKKVTDLVEFIQLWQWKQKNEGCKQHQHQMRTDYYHYNNYGSCFFFFQPGEPAPETMKHLNPCYVLLNNNWTTRKVHSVEMQIHAKLKGKVALWHHTMGQLSQNTLWAAFTILTLVLCPRLSAFWTQNQQA